MTTTAILMYHRVCHRTAMTECYFARGTAITPHHFERQARWLASNAHVVSLEQLRGDNWSTAEGERPAVALTFDDGYLDVLEHVAPICHKLGLPLSVFPIAGHTGASGTLCWVDHYYGLLHRSKRRGPIALHSIAPGEALMAPALEDDIRWWVRGPLKEMLHRQKPEARRASLLLLQQLLEADIDERAEASSLYLSKAHLQGLLSSGVVIGGHGVQHLRLGDATREQRNLEIAGSRRFLESIGVPAPKWFCYPDGNVNNDAAEDLEKHGFRAALTVNPGFATPASNPFALPRFIVRNLPPEQPRWCAAFPCRRSTTVS